MFIIKKELNNSTKIQVLIYRFLKKILKAVSVKINLLSFIKYSSFRQLNIKRHKMTLIYAQYVYNNGSKEKHIKFYLVRMSYI